MDNRSVALTMGIILVSLLLIYGVSNWEVSSYSPNTGNGGDEWVFLQPQKCAEIPWRKDWANTNQQPYSAFPLDEEKGIMIQYYSSRGIEVKDIHVTWQNNTDICNTCGCPEKFVFAIFTNTKDAGRLALSGFNVLDAGDPRLFTSILYQQSFGQGTPTTTSAECDDLFSTNTIIDQLVGNKKDACYKQAAVASTDVSICNKIQNTSSVETCITEVAVVLKDASICESILTTSGKENCWAGVAGVTHDQSTCEKITDAEKKSWCIINADIIGEN